MGCKKKAVVTSHPAENFDASAIPAYVMNGFVRATCRTVDKHFKDPAVQKDFERWLYEDYALRPGVELSEVYKNVQRKRSNGKRNQRVRKEA